MLVAHDVPAATNTSRRMLVVDLKLYVQHGMKPEGCCSVEHIVGRMKAPAQGFEARLKTGQLCTLRLWFVSCEAYLGS